MHEYPKTKRDEWPQFLSRGKWTGYTREELNRLHPPGEFFLATEEKPAAPKGEKPEVWERTQKTMEDIVSGEMGSMGRKVLRETLDKKEAPLTGKDAANAAIGRAIRFGD